MRVITRGIALVLMLLLASAETVHGDVAPDPLNSGLSPSVRSHRVRMSSEEVNIHLGEEQVAIDAVFKLVNLSDKKTVLEVGFPTDYMDDVKGLKVTINGKAVDYREEKEKLFYPDSIDEDGITVNWAMWEMLFPAGMETELRVSYYVKPGRNHGFIITPYRSFIEKIENGQTPGSPASAVIERLTAGMDTFSTGYILVTGAGWEDSIGEAVINVFHDLKGPRVIRRFTPQEGYTFLPDRLQWKFYSLDPDSDIELEFNPSFTVEEEIALVKEALKADEGNDGLKEFLTFLNALQAKMK